MPALSPTMEEGNLVKWLKREGETVKDGEAIAEIETDKATMEVEANDDGVLAKILIQEGTDGVKVNTPIAVLAAPGESVDALVDTAPAAESLKAAPAPTETPTSSEPCCQSERYSHDTDVRVFATPLARRVAAQNGVSLASIQGSGPRGRILKRDVESFSSCSASTQTSRPVSCSRGADGFPDYDLIKPSNMRKTIAKRLVESKHNAPHFYVTADCEIDGLLASRKTLNDSLDSWKLTVNDFVIKALAMALTSVPKANAAYFEDGIHQFRTADISVAVAIDDGLITPVVRSAETKGLLQISRESKELAQKAREGKLRPEEFQGGTFTVSNMGMYGVSSFSAVINPPQGGILAVGAGTKKPIVRDDQIVIGTVMSCTLSVDHRVIDGALAATLLAEFRKNIENPVNMLL